MVSNKNKTRESGAHHGGKVQAIAEEMGIHPDALLDYSANINPYGPPECTREVTQTALKTFHRYPDDTYQSFRQAVKDFLVQFHGIHLEPSTIIPGNGSIELIRLLLLFVAFTQRAPSALIPQPTFSEYAHQAELFGIHVARIPHSSLFEMPAGNLRHYDVVFFCNPNNPTGRLRKRDVLQPLLKKCKEAETLLVMDEAFIELADPRESMVTYVTDYPNLLIIRSLTKIFAVPGLRAGFGVAHSHLSRCLDRFRPPWNMNTCAAVAGRFLLREERFFVQESLKKITEERAFLEEHLSRLGLPCYSGKANFILFDTRARGVTAAELVERMLEWNIVLRDASLFHGLSKWHVRTAVKSRPENEQLLDGLQQCLNNM